MHLTIDFETRSKGDIQKTGPWKYAEHPSTEASCLAVKVNDHPTQIWIYDKFYNPEFHSSLPRISTNDLINLIKRATVIEGHNSEFEQAIYHHIMVERHGFPPLPWDIWKCSAAKAAMHSLPRSLEAAGAALGLATQKDPVGHRIMMKLARPRKPSKHNPSEWYEDPKEYLILFQYCIRDVDTEYELSQSLMDLNRKEKKVWLLDQKINRNGVYIDTETVKNTITLMHEHEKNLLEKLKTVTGGKVHSPRQVEALRKWIWDNGVELDNLTANTVRETLQLNGIPQHIRTVLEIRQSLSRSSTAKYQAMLDRVCMDNRIKSIAMYHAASTGRFGGKGIQPQNLPRGTFSDVDNCIDTINQGDLELLEMLYGDPMAAASTCIRGMICAPPGYDLVCADFSSIEARVLAWLAGEKKVLNAFISGQDLYKVAASGIYKVKYDEVTKQQRQVGKTCVLGCGYQGAVGAFKSMGEIYGINVPDDEAQEIVTKWRNSNRKIVQFWYDCESAAIDAISTPKEVFSVGKLRFGMYKNFLLVKLPSNRYLYYYDPQLMPHPQWENKTCATYMGVNGYTRKWERTFTYGGKLVENITQAVARDFLTDAMLRVEAAGYPIVFTVHDEIVSEIEEGKGSLKDFEQLMAVVPPWGKGCPIEAEGWRGKRYRK